ncbi:hypothetical protein GIB67_018350, partial [Kingdonia uniflora]
MAITVGAWNPTLLLLLLKFPSFRTTTSHQLSLRFYSYPFLSLPQKPLICKARRKKSQLEPLLKPNINEELELELEEEEEEGDVVADEFEDGDLTDTDEFFEDEYDQEETELYAGDGGGGGGISLAGTFWDKEALAVAEDALSSFDGDLKIYAFKTLQNSTIQIRMEKVSN